MRLIALASSGPVNDRHDEVYQQQMEGPRMDARKPERLVGIPSALDTIALHAQKLHDERQHLNLIVDDENRRRGHRRCHVSAESKMALPGCPR